MSTVEDVRKAIQDFLAPELRTISARLEAIDQRFDSFTREMNARFEAVDAKLGAVDAKIDGVHRELSAKIDAISQQLDLERRLARLEAQKSPTTQ